MRRRVLDRRRDDVAAPLPPRRGHALDHGVVRLGAPASEQDLLGACPEEIGDLLFTVVNLCRHEGVDAEGVLRSANAKFENRFRRLESRIAEEGRSPEDVGIEKLEKAWEAVKTEEDGA